MKKNLLASLLLGSLVLVGCNNTSNSTSSSLDNSVSTNTASMVSTNDDSSSSSTSSSVSSSSSITQSTTSSSSSSSSGNGDATSWSQDELDIFSEYLFTTNIPYISGGELSTDLYYYYGALEYYIESPTSDTLDVDYEAALEEAGYAYYYTDEYNSNFYIGDSDNEDYYLLINPYYDDYGDFVIDYYVYGYSYEVNSWDSILEVVDEYLGLTSNIPSCSSSEYYFFYDVTYDGSINVVIPSDDPSSLLTSYLESFSNYTLDDSYASENYYLLESPDSSFAIDMTLYNFETYEDYDSIVLYIYNLYY